MDAIRKKMQSLKGETDQLYGIIRNFEEESQEAVERANQASCRKHDHHFIINILLRLIVIFGTLGGKFKGLRLDMMKPMTSLPRLWLSIKKLRNISRKLSRYFCSDP